MVFYKDPKAERPKPFFRYKDKAMNVHVPPSPLKELTVEEMAIVDEFFANGGVRKYAVMSAGMVAGHGSTFFKRANIKAEVQRRRKKLVDKFEIKQGMIVDEYRKIAFFNYMNAVSVDDNGKVYFDITEMTDDDAAAIKSWGYTDVVIDGEEKSMPVLSFLDKKAALDSLCRVFGYNKDKLSIESSASVIEKLEEAKNRVNKDGQED